MRRLLVLIVIAAAAALLVVAPSAAGPVDPTPPDGPAVVRGQFGCDNDVTLSWEPPSFDGGSPLTGYTVYADDVAVADVGADTLTYGPTSADPSYSVSASNAVGESERVIMTEATIPACVATTTTIVAESPPPAPDPLPRQPTFTG